VARSSAGNGTFPHRRLPRLPVQSWPCRAVPPVRRAGTDRPWHGVHADRGTGRPAGCHWWTTRWRSLRPTSRALPFWRRHGCRPVGRVSVVEHFGATRGVRFDSAAAGDDLITMRRRLSPRRNHAA